MDQSILIVYALIWTWLSISNNCLIIVQAFQPLVKAVLFTPTVIKCTVTSLACRCNVRCNLVSVSVRACVCPRQGDGSTTVIMSHSDCLNASIFHTLSCWVLVSFGAVDWLVKYVRLTSFALEHRHTANNLLQLTTVILKG